MSVRTRPCAVLVAALLAVGLPAVPALAAQGAPPATSSSRAADPATLTVTGEGRASAAPDMATAVVGVEAPGATAQQAMAAQSKAAAAVLVALDAAGVAAEDISTESLALTPVREQPAESGGTTKTVGYRASQGFSVKVRDLKAVGGVLQSVVDAAGDAARVDSVSFGLADSGALRGAARALAHDDAHAKAVQYAELSGRRLGRLVSLTEASSGRPTPVAMPVAAFESSAAKVPVAPGRIEDEVKVTAVYELR